MLRPHNTTSDGAVTESQEALLLLCKDCMSYASVEKMSSMFQHSWELLKSHPLSISVSEDKKFWTWNEQRGFWVVSRKSLEEHCSKASAMIWQRYYPQSSAKNESKPFHPNTGLMNWIRKQQSGLLLWCCNGTHNCVLVKISLTMACWSNHNAAEFCVVIAIALRDFEDSVCIFTCHTHP